MTNMTVITASIPGVFYRRPDPESPVFAEEGDQIKAGEVLGLVGVMKTFHDVMADADGTIVEFLAEDEQLIDAGAELIQIELA
ncbi:MAG: acetyl-CoA carboxylase [Natronomonas sp.]|uniref:acetyl-CoA carboxylase n=1 Tax=Natronomonas sp. TaxID=2184060 RepID=UPI00287060B1|nr:acetyl-CoA carboxylase [Natronomonas sp.]MDR9430826.1 acetyl-CoA carboxylase [Natronomonas sp.]